MYNSIYVLCVRIASTLANISNIITNKAYSRSKLIRPELTIIILLVLLSSGCSTELTFAASAIIYFFFVSIILRKISKNRICVIIFMFYKLEYDFIQFLYREIIELTLLTKNCHFDINLFTVYMFISLYFIVTFSV